MHQESLFRCLILKQNLPLYLEMCSLYVRPVYMRVELSVCIYRIHRAIYGLEVTAVFAAPRHPNRQFLGSPGFAAASPGWHARLVAYREKRTREKGTCPDETLPRIVLEEESLRASEALSLLETIQSQEASDMPSQRDMELRARRDRLDPFQQRQKTTLLAKVVMYTQVTRQSR